MKFCNVFYPYLPSKAIVSRTLSAMGHHSHLAWPVCESHGAKYGGCEHQAVIPAQVPLLLRWSVFLDYSSASPSLSRPLEGLSSGLLLLILLIWTEHSISGPPVRACRVLGVLGLGITVLCTGPCMCGCLPEELSEATGLTGQIKDQFPVKQWTRIHCFFLKS
jgi:hypothetical protein